MDSLILSILGTLSVIITIISWVKDNLREKPRKLIYPILLVLLTMFSTYEYLQNQKKNEIHVQAVVLVASWPKIDDLKFSSKGERIGIILSGLSFLEKYKTEFPETYQTATYLVHNRLKDFKAPNGFEEDIKEIDLLEDDAGAMISMISTIASK